MKNVRVWLEESRLSGCGLERSWCLYELRLLVEIDRQGNSFSLPLVLLSLPSISVLFLLDLVLFQPQPLGGLIFPPYPR